MNPSPDTDRGQLLDVYRQPTRTTICSICRERAFGRCQRCGRPLCLSHLPVDIKERCTDCELQFRHTQHRIARVVGVIVVSIAVLFPITSLMTMVLVGWMPGPLGATALAIGLVLAVGGVVWRIKRCQFLRQGKFPPLLDDIEVPIAPARPGDDRSLLLLGRPKNRWNRLEPPVPKFGMRTYGR